MEFRDLYYVFETDKSFDDAVSSVIRSAEKKGWVIFNVYDFRDKLPKKSLKGSVKIIEACSAKHANLMNRNKLVSVCMPHRISVLEEDGRVRITAMKPALMPKLFEEVGMHEIEETENELKEIMYSAK